MKYWLTPERLLNPILWRVGSGSIIAALVSPLIAKTNVLVYGCVFIILYLGMWLLVLKPILFKLLVAYYYEVLSAPDSTLYSTVVPPEEDAS